MSKAQNEFQVGVSGSAGGCVKYTSKSMTYNGRAGRLWTKWVQQEGGAWMHVGKHHVRAGASEEEVMIAFDSECQI